MTQAVSYHSIFKAVVLRSGMLSATSPPGNGTTGLVASLRHCGPLKRARPRRLSSSGLLQSMWGYGSQDLHVSLLAPDRRAGTKIGNGGIRKARVSRTVDGLTHRAGSGVGTRRTNIMRAIGITTHGTAGTADGAISQ